MLLILRYFKRHWYLAAAAPLLMGLEVLMDLQLPLIMARIVDDGIARGEMDTVLRLGRNLLLFTAAAFVGGAGCTVFSSLASTRLGADLREDLFRKIMGLSHKNLDKLPTGKLIVRLTNDVSQLEDTSRMLLRIMIRSPLQAVGSLIMAVRLSRELSLLLALFIPLLVLSTVYLIRRSYPLFRKMQENLDRLNTRVRENLAGKRVVKVFVREEWEREKFRRANAGLTDASVEADRVTALMHPLMQLLLNGGIIAALWFGAALVDRKTLMIGGLIAYTGYLRQLLFSLMMFSNLLARFSRAQASAGRIEEVLQSRAAIVETAPGSEDLPAGTIEFRNVSFSYSDRGAPVLKGINGVLRPGETLGIIGATGSGKSTLADLIPRFYDPEEGQILIGGRDIRGFSLRNLRRSIAVVPQQSLLFSGSARDNILYHYEEEERAGKGEIMREAAATADMTDFLEGLPAGYDSDVNQRGVNLSGGQKQRLALARALAKEAAVLILDDAFSALDSATEKRIRRALKEKHSDKTIILIAQRISSVLEADKILVLEEGEAAGWGSHGELLAANPLYRQIYESQMDKEAL